MFRLPFLLIAVLSFTTGCATSRSTMPGAEGASEAIPVQEFRASLPDVWKALNRTVTGLGWKVTSQDEVGGVLSAETPMTLWTWGDSVTLVTREVQPGTVRVNITSSTGQAVDWGKNRKNIEAVYSRLETELAAEAPRN